MLPYSCRKEAEDDDEGWAVRSGDETDYKIQVCKTGENSGDI